jgi:L-rhamnose mutarotase
MQRAVYYERIFPGAEAVYDQRHRNVWPEMAAQIRASGVRQLTGFRRGTDVWYYGEYELDARTALTRVGASEVGQRWHHTFRDILAPGETDAGGPVMYDEVFHTNEGPTLPGPMQRAFISLVIDPERAAAYDELHAHPWPDMIAALAESGYRNYSGFRRGAQVVYYGEYYPDIETVSQRMGEHEVNDRWRRAFEGIITTISTPDGRLFTADEVYHQRD